MLAPSSRLCLEGFRFRPAQQTPGSPSRRGLRGQPTFFVVVIPRETRVPPRRANHTFEVVSLDAVVSDGDLPKLELVTAHEVSHRPFARRQ